MAKNLPHQNFPGIYTMIFSKKTIRVVSTPKIRKNKTQYDWFPGKSQNSKKFSAKFKQYPTTSKNHRVFLNILGVKIPPRRSQQILGVKITSKMNSQHRRNTQCANYSDKKKFSKIKQLLKNHYLKEFLNIWGVKSPPGGHNNFWG